MFTSPAAPVTMSGVEWVLLVILSVLWGGSFFFGKIVLAELPPLTVAFGRVAIAAAILVVVSRASGVRLPANWLPYVPMGLLNNALPFTLILWGQTHIASGLAAILNATTPLFTVLVAHVLTRGDKVTRGRALGLAVGFAGVVIMIGPALLHDLGAEIAAQLACLLAALVYAFAGIYGRRFRGHPPMAVATGQLIASTALLAPLVAIVDRPWTLPMPSALAWGALIMTASLSTALGYIIYFRILTRAGATNVLLVTFLIPVSAILLGTAFLGEHLDPRHLVGMAAIALGLAAIDGRITARLARALHGRTTSKVRQ